MIPPTAAVVRSLRRGRACTWRMPMDPQPHVTNSKEGEPGVFWRFRWVDESFRYDIATDKPEAVIERFSPHKVGDVITIVGYEVEIARITFQLGQYLWEWLFLVKRTKKTAALLL